MKRNHFSKMKSLRAVFLLLALILCLLACSSPAPPQFQIIFMASVLSDPAVRSFGETLYEEIPDLKIGELDPLFTSLMVMGSQDVLSPMAMGPDVVMGSMMRFSFMASTAEIDMVIADMENAERFARDDLFLALEDFLSPAELARLKGRLLDFNLPQMEGPMGGGPEKTPLLGIDVTDHPGMGPIFGNLRVGVFVLSNTRHMDQVRRVLDYLL